MRQPFNNLDQLCRQLHVMLPKPRDDWRLVQDPVVGCINGLPFAGGAIATNGILVLLLASDGESILFGHLQWFTPDESEQRAALSDLWREAPLPQLIPQMKDYTTW